MYALGGPARGAGGSVVSCDDGMKGARAGMVFVGVGFVGGREGRGLCSLRGCTEWVEEGGGEGGRGRGFIVWSVLLMRRG